MNMKMEKSITEKGGGNLEKIKEIREYVEAAKVAGTEPRDFLIGWKAYSKAFKEMPFWRKLETKIPLIFSSAEQKQVYEAVDATIGAMDYNDYLGQKLIEAGAIRGDKRLPMFSYIEAKRDPSLILDQVKYREILKKSEEEYLASNYEKVDFKKLTELANALKESRESSIRKYSKENK